MALGATAVARRLCVLRPRGDRPVQPIEFHLVKDGDGPGRHVSTIRRVPLGAVEPSVTEDEPA